VGPTTAIAAQFWPDYPQAVTVPLSIAEAAVATPPAPAFTFSSASASAILSANNDTLSTGAKTGIAVGACLMAIVLLSGVLALLWRMKHKRRMELSGLNMDTKVYSDVPRAKEVPPSEMMGSAGYNLHELSAVPYR
jgi:hypothetical protein